MRLPAYYCPHCKRFKRWYQVTNGDIDYGNCKHCGTEVVDTRLVIESVIEREVRLQQSIKKVRPVLEKLAEAECEDN